VKTLQVSVERTKLTLIHVFGGGEAGWRIGQLTAACRETYFDGYVEYVKFEVMYVSDNLKNQLDS